MDNQHRKIKDYRELTQEEIDLMNEIKAHGEKTKELLDKIQRDCTLADARWIAIARTNFQQAGMALTRSIARPEFFF